MKKGAYEIAINLKYGSYRTWLACMVQKIFDKKTGSGAIVTSKKEANINEGLSQKLHTPAMSLCEI